MTFAETYLQEVQRITAHLNTTTIERMAMRLHLCRAAHGRVFFLGVGGSAANASHAVNDFRKLAGMEAYAPTDNVAEITALTNDAGWESVFKTWLQESRLTYQDIVFVLSVGGGRIDPPVSVNLIRAVQYAQSVGASVLSIVGRENSYIGWNANHYCLVVPCVNPAHVTPHAESFQSIILHALVSHPGLKMNPTKW